MRTLTYIIEDGRKDIRACDYLRKAQGYSARMMTELRKEMGLLTVNGVPQPVVARVSAGDVLCVNLPDDQMKSVPNSEIDAPVVYEDDDIVVFDKPAGVAVHESKKHQTDTLANVFAAHCQKKGVHSVFRAVNRLDRDTSGLVVVAKNRHIASMLSAKVQKRYIAIVCGELPDDAGTIDAPIRRLCPERQIRIVSEDGQHAVTHYRVLARGHGYSVISLTLETGRTHQIRVHLSHIGYPLAGDAMYSGDCTDISRHALHCTEVWFSNAVTGKDIRLYSKLPRDMQELADRIATNKDTPTIE